MMDLSNTLSSAGTDDAFDWKDDDRERRPAREGRTTIPKATPSQQSTGKPVMMDGIKTKKEIHKKELPLNTLQKLTLQAISNKDETIQRPKRLTKKNFKREHNDIRFVSDKKAAQYHLCKKKDETYHEFTKRVPSKIQIKPHGKDYIATMGTGPDSRRYSTQGIHSITVRTKGNQEIIKTSSQPKKREADEVYIPKWSYAAWKIDGERRGISLRDYHQTKSQPVVRYANDGQLVCHKKGANDQDKVSFPDHATFYVDGSGNLNHLTNTYFSNEQVDVALQKLESSGHIESLSPNKDFQLGSSNRIPGDYRLTDKGEEELKAILSASGGRKTAYKNGPDIREKDAGRDLVNQDTFQQMEQLKMVGRAVGFIPELITTEQTKQALNDQWASFYRQEKLTTGTGVEIDAWIPKNNGDHPNFKNQELGHELIFAAGIHHLNQNLTKEGATQIQFIPEAELRSIQTKNNQGDLSVSITDQELEPSTHPVKGIPDGVFLYKDSNGQSQALAVEADAGGSTFSNSKGYSEEMLQSKDAWAQSRGMSIVYVSHTAARAQKIAAGHRHVLYMQK